MVRVNEEQCKRIGKYLKRKRRNPDEYYKFDYPKENPDINLGVVDIAQFYGAVICIDHHFFKIINGKVVPDYGIINGEKFKGATYLWMKSKEMLDKNPDFFSAKNLANLSEKLYEEWLKDGTGKIPIYDKGKHRLLLIRDFGKKLLEYYDGNFNSLYEMSGHKLINSGKGFLERCEIFLGYRDGPLYKKANLVAKVMERRGLWKFEDKENKIPPIDYHLQNVAIRSGMVEILSEDLIKKIKRVEFLNPKEELELRLACKIGYKIVSKVSGIDPYYLDDDFWMEGRKYCQPGPICENALLKPVCMANREKPELKSLPYAYVDTWRY